MYKKSTDYAVGDTITDSETGVVYTKVAESTTALQSGIPGIVELWTDSNGFQWTPSLDFIQGNSEPSFEALDK